MEDETLTDEPFSPPPESASNRLEHDATTRKRHRARVFFVLSLELFIITLCCAGLGSLVVTSWNTRGEGGFIALGAIGVLWMLTLVGVGSSIGLGVLSIPHFRWAVALLVVELLALALLWIVNPYVTGP